MHHVRDLVCSDAFAVTPSDTTPQACLYLYVGTAGDVAVTTSVGTTITYKSVPAGQYVWVKASFVMATNTTASNLVGHI